MQAATPPVRRIVLSRKGFDSSAASGGGPSALLPDGQLVSFPIPENLERRPTASTRYADLRAGNVDYATLLRSLYATRSFSIAHLDPDLVAAQHPGEPRFRGLFGQAGAAAAHLRNQRVAEGDLFLFFGRFRQVERDGCDDFNFAPGRREFHAIFGYMEVGGLIESPAELLRRGEPLEPAQWAPAFPHFLPTRRTRPVVETVYVAARTLAGTSQPGHGVFRMRKELQLSRPDSNRISDWRLPVCFDEVDLSYHPRTPARQWRRNGQHVEFCAAARGQEFACAATPEIHAWAARLIIESETWGGSADIRGSRRPSEPT